MGFRGRRVPFGPVVSMAFSSPYRPAVTRWLGRAGGLAGAGIYGLRLSSARDGVEFWSTVTDAVGAYAGGKFALIFLGPTPVGITVAIGASLLGGIKGYEAISGFFPSSAPRSMSNCNE